jgi:hypothetical protein
MGRDRFGEFFFEHFFAVDDLYASFDLGFGWETTSAFTHRFEKMAVGRRVGIDLKHS